MNRYVVRTAPQTAGGRRFAYAVVLSLMARLVHAAQRSTIRVPFSACSDGVYLLPGCAALTGGSVRQVVLLRAR